jgi:hypothetical protein
MSDKPINSPSSTNRKWYSLTIDDPELTTGSSFKRLVGRATRFVECTAVKMSDLVIVPPVPLAMEANVKQCLTLTWDVFFSSLQSITQFVWGRFFFYSDLQAAKDAGEEESLLQRIEASELTICILDNTSYAIFTTSLLLVCDLLADDWPLELKKDELSTILPKQVNAGQLPVSEER